MRKLIRDAPWIEIGIIFILIYGAIYFILCDMYNDAAYMFLFAIAWGSLILVGFVFPIYFAVALVAYPILLNVYNDIMDKNIYLILITFYHTILFLVVYFIKNKKKMFR